MTPKELGELTDQELLQEAKKIKSTNITDALFIGLLFGIAVYSTGKNGWGVLTFLPLVYAPIAVKNKARNKAVEDLLKERNLK
ncbi:MAG: FUSC family protein [Chitinophagaceae bacterium]|nr:MAG: FUSC family protein [Chitinophagaceae bacterium]